VTAARLPHHSLLTTHFQLRDIFRIDPDTACNTHDLLECPCNGMSKPNPLEPVDINRAQLDEDVQYSDDSEPEKGFIAAAQVKSEDINKVDKVASFSIM